jgi:hypothetical protein
MNISGIIGALVPDPVREFGQSDDIAGEFL